MATSKRADIIETLRTTLSAIIEIQTFKVVSNIDNKYPTDLNVEELPAIKLCMPDEAISYNTALHAMNKISADMFLYCIEENKDSITACEELLKLVRNKIGENLTLQFKCVNIDIRNIVAMEVLYPLVMYKINLDIKYDGNIKNL